jgi:Flp pilus assembly protein TadG
MRSRRGSSIIEFTLVAIPIMFVMISIFEMGRGMWNYHTLAEAVKEGARWAIVNGQNCSDTGNSCTCPIAGSGNVGNSIDCIARTIGAAAIGLPPSTINVTIIINGSAPVTITCQPLNSASCYGNTTALTEAIGSDIRIKGSFQFQSALAMFWPGVRSRGVQFGTFVLSANSHQVVQY